MRKVTVHVLNATCLRLCQTCVRVCPQRMKQRMKQTLLFARPLSTGGSTRGEGGTTKRCGLHRLDYGHERQLCSGRLPCQHARARVTRPVGAPCVCASARLRCDTYAAIRYAAT